MNARVGRLLVVAIVTAAVGAVAGSNFRREDLRPPAPVLLPCTPDEVPAQDCEMRSGELRFVVKAGVAAADLRLLDTTFTSAHDLLVPAFPRTFTLVVEPGGSANGDCCTADMSGALVLHTGASSWTTSDDVWRARTVGQLYTQLTIYANGCTDAPAWLKMGLAEWVALRPIGTTIGGPEWYERMQVSERTGAARTRETLQTTEASAADAVPELSYLAVSLLLEHREVRQVGTLCNLLRPGSSPAEPFEKAFGLSLARFYDEFEAARRAGFPATDAMGASAPAAPSAAPRPPADSGTSLPRSVSAQWTSEAAPGGIVVEVEFIGFAAGTSAVWESVQIAGAATVQEGRSFTLTPDGSGVARLRPGALLQTSAVTLVFRVDGQRYTIEVR